MPRKDVIVTFYLFIFWNLVALDRKCFQSFFLFIVTLIIKNEPFKDFKIRKGVKNFKNLLIDLGGSWLEKLKEGLHLETRDHFGETLSKIKDLLFRYVFRLNFGNFWKWPCKTFYFPLSLRTRSSAVSWIWFVSFRTFHWQ